jgi:hypothetical protein
MTWPISAIIIPVPAATSDPFIGKLTEEQDIDAVPGFPFILTSISPVYTHL